MYLRLRLKKCIIITVDNLNSSEQNTHTIVVQIFSGDFDLIDKIIMFFFCFVYRNCDKWKRAFPSGTRNIEEKTKMQVLCDTITRDRIYTRFYFYM